MLSLYEKAAGLLFVRLGSNLHPPLPAHDDAARIEALLRRCPVGGLLLFNGCWPETPQVLARLQAASRVPLLVGTDMERGVGQQVAGATEFPHAMAFGAAGDEALVAEAARIAAREAQACGVHIAFAPVADVNLNPRNPIIATRAFGVEPQPVARFVGAYVRACRAEGLLTTAKHFPGHGRTAADSHAELPVVGAARADLEEADLVPFRTALEAGVDAVMTAHVAFPALDAEKRPATLSPPILRGLLREEMGFRGPVFTDSLLMGAVQATHATPGAQAAALLRAGVDALLDPDDPEAVARGLTEAVEQGALEEARLNEAHRRVQALRQKLSERFGEAAFAGGYGLLAGGAAVGSAEHRRVTARVVERAVTVERQSADALPIPPSEAAETLIVRLSPRTRGGGDAEEAPLGRAVRETLPGAAYHEVGGDAEADDLKRLRGEAQRAGHVVLVLAVQPAAWTEFGLRPAQEAFVRALTEERTVVVAALGSPHVLAAFPRAAAQVCTYTTVAPAQEALLRALTGRPSSLS